MIEPTQFQSPLKNLTVNRQLSTQPSARVQAVNYQLSTCLLSTVNYQLSTINCQLKLCHCTTKTPL
ncbi:MAG: hypothetical protein HC786_18510 [Richelia sp. CSU_2_1]|nr:hypothetical protein [Microcoleus sp. SU_5_6]NJR24002.1 hypothetical protein [Richelia sp. CSU_2_1]